MKITSLLPLILISLTSLAGAHPGGLDANGGHYNRKTGEYHYHRKPADKPAAEEKRTGSAQRARPITKTAGTTMLAKGVPATRPVA